MKINVNIDCTPEEARHFFGLPDLTPVHEAYVAGVMETMKSGVSPDVVDSLMKSWANIGGAGPKMWQEIMGSLAGGKKG